MLQKQAKRFLRHKAIQHFRANGVLLTWGFFVLVMIIAFANHMENQEREKKYQETKQEALQVLTMLRSSLEREMNRDFFQLGALVAYISVNPDIAEEDFNIFAQNLLRQRSHVIRLGAAPAMVLKYAYPYEENKSDLGLDYNKTEALKELAQRAKITGKPILAGPLVAQQNKNVLIAWAPVYLAEDVVGKEAGSFWGLVSILIDAKDLLEAIGVVSKSYDFSMRGKDAKGKDGAVFFGNPQSFSGENAVLEVPVPGGTWQISATSKLTPPNMETEIVLIRLIALFLCLSVITFTTFRLRSLKERRKAGELLERALLDAEKANRAKSEFLANMSHELRTPLNAIIGFSDLICNADLAKMNVDKITEYATDINQSGHHLLQIINEILDLSKVETGNFTTTIETVYLQDIAEHTLRLTRNAMTKKGVVAVNSISDDLPSIQSDERMIKQIFFNLLSNAVKFTPKGGQITLSVDLSDKGVQKITVTDTGIGMSKEDLVTALQTFGQADSYLVRSQEGTGLGLPLVKAFMELLGGKLYIKSQVGVGTEVTLIFPVASPAM